MNHYGIDPEETKTCAHCGQVFHEEALTKINGDYVCDECLQGDS